MSLEEVGSGDHFQSLFAFQIPVKGEEVIEGRYVVEGAAHQADPARKRRESHRWQLEKGKATRKRSVTQATLARAMDATHAPNE